MRLGCIGCLSIIVILVVLVFAGTWALLFSTAIFSLPEKPIHPDYTASDGYRGQQKLAEIILRERQLSRGRAPVAITQRELNAFLANHLEEGQSIPLSPLAVRFTPGTIEIHGQTTLKRLFTGLPFSLLGEYLPQSYAQRPVWVTVQGRVKLDKHTGYFDILDFSLGKQPAPPWLLSWMLGRKGHGLLQWQLPASVDRIVIEEGRAVIHTRP